MKVRNEDRGKQITFECVATLLETNKLDNLQECKASLNDLKDILKDEEHINDKNLMYFVGDLAVAGVPNKNDDGITVEDAIRVYKDFERKQINIEHDRNKICGYIVKSILTDENHNPLTNEEALALNKPVYISIGFVIWPFVDETLSSVLSMVGDTDSSSNGLISLSWEMNFDEFNILLGESQFEGELITDESEIEKIYKNLKAYNGKGVITAGDKSIRVSRFVTGENLFALGGGLVVRPAANVKGIAIVANEQNEQELISEVKNIIDEKLSTFEESLSQISARVCSFEESLTPLQEKYSQLEKSTVTKNSKNIMKIKSINDITDEALKSEEIKACEVVSFISDELSKKSEEYSAQLKSEAEAKELAEQKIVSLSSEIDTLKSELDKVTSELNKINELRAAEQIEKDFSERMTNLDEEFELTDEDRRVIASKIRGLNEEDYKAWKADFDILASAKNKAVIKANEEKKKSKEITASEEKSNTNSEGVIDNVTSKETFTSAQAFSEDAIAKYRDAFSVEKGFSVEL